MPCSGDSCFSNWAGRFLRFVPRSPTTPRTDLPVAGPASHQCAALSLAQSADRLNRRDASVRHGSVRTDPPGIRERRESATCTSFARRSAASRRCSGSLPAGDGPSLACGPSWPVEPRRRPPEPRCSPPESIRMTSLRIFSRVGVEVEQYPRGDTLVVAHGAEEDVLGTDVVVPEAECLTQRQRIGAARLLVEGIAAKPLAKATPRRAVQRRSRPAYQLPDLRTGTFRRPRGSIMR